MESESNERCAPEWDFPVHMGYDPMPAEAAFREGCMPAFGIFRSFRVPRTAASAADNTTWLIGRVRDVQRANGMTPYLSDSMYGPAISPFDRVLFCSEFTYARGGETANIVLSVFADHASQEFVIETNRYSGDAANYFAFCDKVSKCARDPREQPEIAAPRDELAAFDI